MTHSTITQPDLGERVYEVVHDRIMTSELPPGSNLSLTRLAHQLGVSLTPVRDALNRLAAEGLVVEVPRKGYFVSKLEPHDITELMEARLIIELAAAKLGLERATAADLDELRRLVEEMERLRPLSYLEYSKRDYTFHQTLVAAAKNGQLLHFHRTLGIHVHAHRQTMRANLDDNGESALREHRAILEGFLNHDLPSLCTAVSAHIDRTTKVLLAHSEL